MVEEAAVADTFVSLKTAIDIIPCVMQFMLLLHPEPINK